MEPTVNPLPPDEPPNHPALPELSEREIEVLRLVATGVGNKEIAQKLSISPNTVKVHLRNIFGKIGAGSRTEAAMYAIQRGLVEMPNAPQGDQPPAVSITPETEDLLVSPANHRRPWLIWTAAAVLTVVLLGAAAFWLTAQSRLAVPLPTASPAPPRWQPLADMPTARSGLAAAVYNDQIYAIGGEGTAGVTGIVERYDLTSNTWEGLPSMPTPVTDVSAVVIGGQIYVPGGRLASGVITNTLEMYDPRDQRWAQLAPMPTALSAYALAAFEGRIYVFGGWDSHQYVSLAYEYSPDLNQWSALPPMPTARGYAGAAAANGLIYIIGGVNNNGANLVVNEAFSPNQAAGSSTWKKYASLPVARAKMGVTSIVNIVYLVGGIGESPRSNALEYFAQLDEWRTLSIGGLSLVAPGVSALGTNLYSLGGQLGSDYTHQVLAYQAVYIISLPLVK